MYFVVDTCITTASDLLEPAFKVELHLDVWMKGWMHGWMDYLVIPTSKKTRHT